MIGPRCLGLLVGVSLFVPPVSALAATETIIHSFNNITSSGDGVEPLAGLLQDKLGNLWGTTYLGGSVGKGTVFMITAAGTYSIVHSFKANSGVDGMHPAAGLIQDKKGNLWGTTTGGGAKGGGTVFKMTAAGAYSIKHKFVPNSADGRLPNAGLLQDKNGDFWGTTTLGGGNAACINGCGTIFKITAAGVYSIVHSFAGGVDGRNPLAGLIQDKNGNLWGTSQFGGANDYGTVFTINAAGAYSIVHNFLSDGIDGRAPYAGLLQDKNGNLWGTTQNGGVNGGGIVFKIDTAGAYSIVRSFVAGGADGNTPQASLIQDHNGNLWGTTFSGGASNAGTVFEINAAGTYSIAHSFTPADGENPEAALIVDNNGHLWGTTRMGGPSGGGTVFEITP